MRRKQNRRTAHRKARRAFVGNVVGKLRETGRYSRHYLKDLEKGLIRSGYYEHVTSSRQIKKPKP